MSDDPTLRPSTVLGPLKPSGGQVLPFRRRPVKPRRKKRGLLRSLWRPLSLAVLLVGLPLGGGYWAVSTPGFALQETVVAGAEEVPLGWIEAALQPLAGRNLLILPLEEVDARLAGHPWIAGLEVSKELPGRLVVQVVERRPAARVPIDGAAWLTDATGRPIEAEGERGAVDLPLVTGGEEPRVGVPGALGLLAELRAAEPTWARGVREVEMLAPDEARLLTDALPFPLLVRAGQIEPKAGRLNFLLGEIETRYPGLESLDLRFAGRIVLRPGKAGWGAGMDASNYVRQGVSRAEDVT
ncbi:MAG: FtsQ-type POTRA domain-containing protein [Acidobacteriota bacterium]